MSATYPPSPPGALVTSSIATSFPDNTTTAVVFDAAVADSGGFWNPAQPTRLTVPQAGLYFISGNIEFTASTAGERVVLIRRNGGEGAIGGGSIDLGHGETYVPSTIATDTPQVHAKTAAVLNAGDYVELFGLCVGVGITLQSHHVPPNTPQLAVLYQRPV